MPRRELTANCGVKRYRLIEGLLDVTVDICGGYNLLEVKLL
jgi:hypothetical protein